MCVEHFWGRTSCDSETLIRVMASVPPPPTLTSINAFADNPNVTGEGQPLNGG